MNLTPETIDLIKKLKHENTALRDELEHCQDILNSANIQGDNLPGQCGKAVEKINALIGFKGTEKKAVEK